MATATTTEIASTTPSTVGPRRPGRPSEGTRVAVRIPDALLAQLDDLAARAGTSRALVFREVMRIGLGRAADVGTGGVDRAQIQRQLAMTPAERIVSAGIAANRLDSIRGAALR